MDQLLLVRDGEDVEAEVRLQELDPLPLDVAPGEEVAGEERQVRDAAAAVAGAPLLAQRQVERDPAPPALAREPLLLP